EKETVVLVVAAEPDGVLVDANAVFLLRPFVASPIPAPGLHDIAVRIELDDWGRRDAALGARWILPGRRLEPCQAAWPLHDPDVVALIDRHACDLAERPVVGQRLGPERVDLELRDLGRHRAEGHQQCAGNKPAAPPSTQPPLHVSLPDDSLLFACRRLSL